MSKNGNNVIISEYQAPDDFKCIWSKETKTDIRTKDNGKETRIEKLFIAPYSERGKEKKINTVC
jgi:DNA adenine methylase